MNIRQTCAISGCPEIVLSLFKVLMYSFQFERLTSFKLDCRYYVKL